MNKIQRLATNKKVVTLKVIVTHAIAFSILLSVSVQAGWQDWAKEADSFLKSTTGKDTASTVSTSLSNDEIAQGLKEALDVGVKKAIDMLGRENGFLNDKSVRIPMPEQLQQVEKVLRMAGQDQMADEFVTSMNRAAEQAVPKVTNVFVDAISKMSLSDAQAILSGGDTAATDYFRQHTSVQLSQLIKPYVTESMGSNEVTQYYQSMLSMAKQYDTFGLLNQYLGKAANLEDYVTDKTMNGLFSKIAEQEAMIRQNPAARTTDILKSVFGSLSK